MPVYEFTCRDCAERVEVRATIAEKQAGLDPACPSCGSTALRRMLSTFAVRGGRVPQAAGAPRPSGGGCCGGGCCAPTA